MPGPQPAPLNGSTRLFIGSEPPDLMVEGVGGDKPEARQATDEKEKSTYEGIVSRVCVFHLMGKRDVLPLVV